MKVMCTNFPLQILAQLIYVMLSYLRLVDSLCSQVRLVYIYRFEES